MGGNGVGKPRLSRELTKGLTDEEALRLIDKIITYYKTYVIPNRRIGFMIDNMDFEQFKTDILK